MIAAEQWRNADLDFEPLFDRGKFNGEIRAEAARSTRSVPGARSADLKNRRSFPPVNRLREYARRREHGERFDREQDERFNNDILQPAHGAPAPARTRSLTNFRPSNAICSGVFSISLQIAAAAQISGILKPKLSIVSHPSYPRSRSAPNTSLHSTCPLPGVPRSFSHVCTCAKWRPQMRSPAPMLFS